MSLNLFRLKTEKLSGKLRLLILSGAVGALAFTAIVGFVLYKAFSTAFFVSEEAAARQELGVEDEQLQQALRIAEKWQEGSAETPTPVTAETKENELSIPAKEEIRIIIRNGTELAGLAGAAAENLRSAGFGNILEVENAARQDYEKTLIQSKLSVRIYQPEVIGALGLTEKEVEAGDLPETEEFDILIVLGQEGR